MRYLCGLLFILFSLNLLAYNVEEPLRGYVKDKEGNPITGAVVFWEGDQAYVYTASDGSFRLDLPAATPAVLSIEMIGYAPVRQEIDDLSTPGTYVLHENLIMDEVVISQTTGGRLKNRFEVFQVESIGTRELSRAACCNLSESFETNPSVDVSYSDAVTGAKQIQLLGLAGTYVQMLTENYPNMRGVSASYGMDYVPGPWLQSIQVSKGAASVKNGFESTTGQINIEYKKPQQADPLSINAFVGDDGRVEGNVDGAFALTDKLYTGILAHYSREGAEHDKNGDTFLDMPKKQQFNVMNRWHYQTEKFISQSGIKYVNDERTSGQTSHTIPGGDPYTIQINTNRGEFFTKNGFILDPEKSRSIALILTATYHDQQSEYFVNRYDVRQKNIYGSLMYESDWGEQHKISTGLSINWDHYRQQGNVGERYDGLQPAGETTSGAYVQYTFMPNDKLTLLAGLRVDYSTIHDWFVTPRIHVRYSPFPWINLRVSGGKGYRTAFALPENSYLLASSRRFVIAPDLRQEDAWNTGAGASFYIPVKEKEWTISAEWYYTRFNNQLTVDLDSDPHQVLFYNQEGLSDSQVLQLETSYPFFRGFTLLAAYRWMNPRSTYGGKLLRKPLVSRYKALATASYETKLRKWQFDLTAQLNGGGRMPRPDEQHPLWEQHFSSYTILNAQITRYFRDWSVYIGAENLGDFRQKNPIISSENPMGPDFDATMVWGPTMGRKLYIGFRYNISK